MALKRANGWQEKIMKTWLTKLAYWDNGDVILYAWLQKFTGLDDDVLPL